jgi:hypothetical protein
MQIVIGSPPIFTFSHTELARRAEPLRETFRNAQPFPHVVIDDFLPVDVADRVLKYFPEPDAPFWLDWTKRDTVHQPKKQGIGHASKLEGAPPYLHNVLMAFNSSAFLQFLEELTGIRRLLPDPHFHGGGLHQILSGGKLAMHADSTILEPLQLYRRLNVLVYLNKDWKPEYGGNLELWDRECSRCEQSIAPLFNRLVLFETTKTSFHGHPKPLNTPQNVTRKSLALYYFTSQPGAGEKYGYDIDWKET